MYETEEKLKEKIEELIKAVEEIDAQTTGADGVLEKINSYIKNNKGDFNAIKKFIIHLLINQSKEDNANRLPLHSKTKQAKSSFYGMVNCQQDKPADELYRQVLPVLIVELEDNIKHRR